MKKRFNSDEAYIHTLDKMPAWFDGDQIVFAQRSRFAIPTVATLKEINRNEKSSYKFRANHGFGTSEMDYGYLRIKLIPISSHPKAPVDTAVQTKTERNEI